MAQSLIKRAIDVDQYNMDDYEYYESSSDWTDKLKSLVFGQEVEEGSTQINTWYVNFNDSFYKTVLFAV